MCIKATKRFLNAVLDIPENIVKDLVKVIENIKTSHPREARKIKNGDFWRKKVAHDYRLFYAYSNGCISLLHILRRNERTYKNIDGFNTESLADIETEDLEETRNQPFLDYGEGFLSRKQIQRWRIERENYYCQDLLDDLLKLKDENDLYNFIEKYPLVGTKYIYNIIDILPNTIQQVSKENFYEIDRSESLLDFYNAQDINKFLLALSDEQKRIIVLDEDSPILVKGGPGTGKSIMALHRARTLLLDRKAKRILFTTHTQTLVDYFTQLCDDLFVDDEKRKKIEIRTVDNIVKDYISHSNLILASQEISEFCLSSIVNNIDFHPKIKTELNRLSKSSILEEITGTIESKGILDLKDYQQKSNLFSNRNNHWATWRNISRRDKNDLLQAIWKIYEKWKEILHNSGYTTIEQSRRTALKETNPDFDKCYDAVIIDEAQDLSPTSLRLLVKLVKSTSGLFLTADTSQSLDERSFGWNFIDESRQCITKELTKSFRNTKEIGKACPIILLNRVDIINNPVMDFCNVLGEKPTIFLTDDLLEQSEIIIDFFKKASKKWNLPVHAGAILVPNELHGLFISTQLNHAKLKTKWVDNNLFCNEKQDYIKVLSLRSSKGLEFPFVAIIGLKQDVLPRSMSDFNEEEKKLLINQERRLFYVGCSRAMRSLLVCGSKSKCSCFIEEIIEKDINRYQKQEEAYWQIREY